MTPPLVRYFLLCEGIHYDPADRRVSIEGLISNIRIVDGIFPARHEELWIYLQLADCRGTGGLRIRVTQADTDRAIFESARRTLQFPSDPLQTHSIHFGIRDLLFEESGLFYVEVWYNNSLLDQRPLFVK
jgi:hypothetical protein